MIRKMFLLFAVMTVNFSAFADWKEDIINEMVGVMEKMSEKIAEVPTIGVNRANSAFGFYSSMSGLCVGLVSTSGISLPESTIMRSARLNEKFMRGEIPSSKDISQIGLDCLTHMENEMITLGMSKKDVEKTMAPLMKLQLQALQAKLFNLK